jgi:hypothetical protein
MIPDHPLLQCGRQRPSPRHVTPPRVDPVGLCRRSEDAACVLDDERLQQMPWTEERIRPDDERLPPLDSRMLIALEINPDDRRRIRAIDHWIDTKHGGDVTAALQESPLLIQVFGDQPRFQDDTAKLIDGWHRLVVIRRRAPATVSAIILHGRHAADGY